MINLLHGIFMFLAWGVFPLLGIYIARYLKHRLLSWWFRAHILIMVLCGVFTLIGFLLVYNNETHHFKSAHQVFIKN
jgi:uncharacterized membrane protein